MNEGDIANDIHEHNLSVTLSRRQTFDEPSLWECSECGEEICENRRKLGSVTRCLECQNKYEKRKRHFSQ